MIVSVKAPRKKIWILGGALLLVALLTIEAAVSPTEDDAAEAFGKDSLHTAATREEQIAFLQRFGWEVSPGPPEESEVSIPQEFDKLYAGYNSLQKTQGFDLSSYGGKRVVRCRYAVTNYPGYTGDVIATLLIYHDRVIGGDIAAAQMNGFTHGFEKFSRD